MNEAAAVALREARAEERRISERATQPAAGAPARHFAALDGLRGVAALVVVLRHVVNATRMPAAWRDQVVGGALAPLVNSQGAVQVFFVLSGWVLAASLARGTARPIGWLPFWVRRIVRIHVPFVCAALFAFALSRYWGVPDPHAVTRWLRAYVIHPSFGHLLASLAFPGKAAGLLPIGWTLTIEMVYSFALPAIVLAARPLRGLPLLALALGGLLTPWRTAWYGIDFALGVVAFREREAIAHAIHGLRAPLRAAIPLVGLVLLSIPLWIPMAPRGAPSGRTPTEILLMGVGSTLLVVSAVSLPRFAAAMGWRPFEWLGRISYGVYLLHRPLLTFLAPRVFVPTLLASKLIRVEGVTLASALAVLALVVLGSIALAVPFHRFVEQPAIALGHRLARGLERALGLAAPATRVAPQESP